MRLIDRRIKALEAVIIPPQPREYPPLAPAEIADLAQRIESGEKLATAELDRLEQHSPVIHGEILMTCYERHLVLKRYGGIDLVNL